LEIIQIQFCILYAMLNKVLLYIYNMKKYICSFLLLYAALFQLNAKEFSFNKWNDTLKQVNTTYQIAPQFYAAQDSIIAKEIKKAKRLKIAGLFFTSVGGAGTLVTASFVGLYHAFGKFGKIYGNTVGFIGFSPSIAFLSAGIPMTVVGYKKHNKLKQQQLRKEF